MRLIQEYFRRKLFHRLFQQTFRLLGFRPFYLETKGQVASGQHLGDHGKGWPALQKSTHQISYKFDR